jgi:Ribonuclease HI
LTIQCAQASSSNQKLNLSTLIEIYTDGSCDTLQRNGAWVSILLFVGQKMVLTGEEINTTHNRIELLAVIASINFIDKEQPGAELIVYTDSQYVCGITERKEKLKQESFLTNKGSLIQNVDLVQTLIRQIETHNIRFVKVKAHQQIDTDASLYNNQADRLSRKMIRNKDKSSASLEV